LLDVIGSMRAPPSASDRIDAQMQDAEVILGGVEAAAGVVEAVAAIAPESAAIAETPAEAQEWELEQEWGWVEHLLTPGAFPEEEAEVAGGMFFKTLEMTNSSTFEPIRRLICVPLSCRPADGQHAEHHLLEPTVTCMQKYEKSIPNCSRSKR
jgi:hypothetical protein